MKKDTYFKLLMLVIFSIAIYFGYSYFRYDVEYKVCDIDYTGCTVIAKFKDRDDCEITKEYWNWKCDKSDSNNIICSVGDDSLAVGYCD